MCQTVTPASVLIIKEQHGELFLQLKCCPPRWRWWVHLPARCQTPAASGGGHGGASCRPAPTPRKAEPEWPLGPERRELMSPHGTELVHPQGLLERKEKVLMRTSTGIWCHKKQLPLWHEAHSELLEDLMAEETTAGCWWCCCCSGPGSSKEWLDGKTELWSTAEGSSLDLSDNRAQTQSHCYQL